MPTRKSTLGDVGNLAATPGSREWAVAVRLDIQATLKDVRGDAEHLQTMLGLLRRHEGWKELTGKNGLPFPSYEAFCVEGTPEGLGYQTEDIDRIIGERRARDAQERANNPKTTNPNGRPKKCSDTTVLGRGADYLTARIARDRPDILERMKEGEFPSVRAAGIAAGIVKVPTALEVCQKAFKKLSRKEKAAFLAWASGPESE